MPDAFITRQQHQISMKYSYFVELLIITLVGIFFFALCAPVPNPADQSTVALDLQPVRQLFTDPGIRPAGIEHERLAGILSPIRVGIQRYGHVPFWNSYLSNGVPLFNNAFNYFFNPFHSLPVLLLGDVTGTKIAILLALLIAGYNTWLLGYTIGCGALARVSMACLYLLNGGIVAKFGAGHFQLACSLAWVPLVIASMWWLLHSKKRIAPIAFGISFALLFYAGNIYYTLHTLIACCLLIVTHLVGRKNNRWHFYTDRLFHTAIALALAFGLSALLFFPVWQTRTFVTHTPQEINGDGTLVNNYNLAQAAANLTQPWYTWHDQRPESLSDAVDYNNIGMISFILIALAAGLWLTNQLRHKKQPHFRPYKRLIPVALSLALLMMLWAGGQTQPIPWLYARIPLLAEFRYLGRALAVAALWWIVLGGIALDILWKTVCERVSQHRLPNRRHILFVVAAAVSVWLFMSIYSASPSGTRISMTLRNINLWQSLDPLRYTSLPDALRGFATLLLVFASIDAAIYLARHVWQRLFYKQTFSASGLLTYALQLGLLGGVILGVMDVMLANTPALQFAPAAPSFLPIYDTIRRADIDRPFPSVSLPFSPLTFEVYDSEIRVWSLNEGWLPAAPPDSVITMGRIVNPPRWLIAKRDANGAINDPRVETFIQQHGYQRRTCFQQTSFTQPLADCSAFVSGADLYELPDALPYAFLVTEADLTNNPETLRRSRVQPVTILDYQQDNLTLSVTTDNSTRQFLVVQESNFPGWQVAVDGQAVQPVTVPTEFIGQQTLGLLAVPIEKGSHTVTLRFEPPGLTLGIAVFVTTLVLILVYLTRRPKQKSPA
ncbi:MAG: YfhO family protein [Chloroflexi bacterium]|nr:YfhO family protein [Chloroflexota bacterium]MCC6896696.1 YfhO family protein [Anaerolineae bacterium]